MNEPKDESLRGSEMRRLPYGANYLAWDDMPELQQAVDNRVLFRYQAPNPSTVDRFENQMRARLEVPFALATLNCTQALRVALMATRPNIGDPVYIPAVTFVAVAGAVLSCGLIPVLVDVDDNFCLDPQALPDDAHRVIVAHMEGVVSRLPDGPAFVIEDAAQAMGARHHDGTPAGSAGWAGAFSFHHNKVLTTGEGGLLVSSDEVAFKLMRQYHDHGAERIQGEYPQWRAEAFFGENCVMSEATAAIGLQQLRHLDEILSGLARAYALTVDVLTDAHPNIVVRGRGGGDVPISVRLECADADLRERAIKRLRDADLPYWTLDRYFLPDHPVIMSRQSLYADGFPWSNTSINPVPAGLEPVRERLHRTLCFPLSPERDAHGQLEDAIRCRDALRRL